MNSTVNTCAGCTTAVTEFFSRGVVTFRAPTIGRVEIGLCQTCYARLHRSASSMKTFQRRINNNVGANPERFRVPGMSALIVQIEADSTANAEAV